MFRARNTLVAVELIEIKEKKIGNITLPTNSELYCEGIVLAVGPGNINAAGARTETHDLHEGDRVLVKRYEVRPHGQGLAKSEAGIKFVLGGKEHMLFEQTSLVAVLDAAPQGSLSL
jgi:co-chaperonin GroES (HSP10)